MLLIGFHHSVWLVKDQENKYVGKGLDFVAFYQDIYLVDQH